ncbi:MAG: hypothetical protein COT73_02310 [Bdellovibrio sp. CG10_big_fil_rev_8_21_14_0_10_47_8]|nr:MAG: hypothetical protein COT73_02310 [Bdellovibrio sp. CG10_big_fil_rev_8_21_14_0_10_47_8]
MRRLQVGFSIRYKFLAVMSLLLAACVCVYLLIAVRVFKSDKTELVFDLNRSQVSNLASELDTQFEGISDKFKLFSLLSDSALQGRTQADWVRELFPKDSDVVFVSLYRRNGQEIVRKFQNQSFGQTYGLSKDYFERTLAKAKPIPFSRILKDGQAIWNASAADGPPLVGFGRSVVIEDHAGVAIDQMAVVGYVKMDKLLKSLSLVKLNHMSVVNRDGEVLASSMAEAATENRLMGSHPLFQAAMSSKTKTSVINLTWQDEKILGAYSKSFGGKLLVLAQANEASAFVAVEQLVERSLIFSLIVMTAAFLAAILLSRSLTRPLAQLVERMNLASQGDLTTQIHLGNKDETAVLAGSFNQMIADLKQSRDALEEINRDLDQKVKDRTQQLEEQNRAVKEAQEALLRTTRLASIGEVAGRAAHEVLNPLTSLMTRLGIMERKMQKELTPQLQVLGDMHSAWDKDYQEGGFDQLVQVWKKPSEIQPQLNLWQEDLGNLQSIQQGIGGQLKTFLQDTEFLKREGTRINKIINSMRKLTVTKSDKTKQSVHHLLSECCAIMGDLFEQKKFSVLCEFTAEQDSVSIDRDEFIQSVTNMMRNSLQAMDELAKDHPEQKFQLRLMTAVVKDEIQIYIEDNGVGVPTQYQSHLFESQFTTKGPEEGTGLGLGISRRFLRANGGDIEFVSSDLGRKTVFRIRVPIVGEKEKGAAA